MTPRRFRKLPTATVFGVAVAALALVAGGCGSSNDDNSTGTNASAATASPGTLATGKTDLGTILVGAKGRTLYLFEKDKNGKSACSGACAAVWTPFTSAGSQVSTAGSADKAKVTTTKRSDGKLQVVYAGHPLYYYVPDTQAGQTSGEGLDQFGAEWYVVSPAGKKVEESGE